MDQILDQLRPLLDMLARHAWIPAAALVIGLLARAAKEPAVGSLFARVPRQHRARVVLALGVLSGVLDAIVRGTPAGTAIAYGVISAALAVLGHGTLGGTSPDRTASEAKGVLLEVVDVPGVDVPAGEQFAPPDLTPTPDTSGLSAGAPTPIVEPAEQWGPTPRPSER